MGGTIGLDYLAEIGFKGKVNFSLAYSYIDGNIDIDKNGPEPERNLPGISVHSLKFIAGYTTGPLTFSLRGQTYGAQHAFGQASVLDNDPTKYKTIPGYTVLNFCARYKISDYAGIFVTADNFADMRYRNANIGAGAGGGSSAVEFDKGAPQNPIRISWGLNFTL